MPRLRIEHKANDFIAWNRAFDSDALNREESGATRFEIWRSLEPVAT